MLVGAIPYGYHFKIPAIEGQPQGIAPTGVKTIMNKRLSHV
jgi:hypothetical protein